MASFLLHKPIVFVALPYGIALYPRFQYPTLFLISLPSSKACCPSELFRLFDHVNSLCTLPSFCNCPSFQTYSIMSIPSASPKLRNQDSINLKIPNFSINSFHAIYLLFPSLSQRYLQRCFFELLLWACPQLSELHAKRHFSYSTHDFVMSSSFTLSFNYGST